MSIKLAPFFLISALLALGAGCGKDGKPNGGRPTLGGNPSRKIPASDTAGERNQTDKPAPGNPPVRRGPLG